MHHLQSGFRKNRSTTDHVLRLQDAILKNNRFRGYTLAVFIDFKYAFDMVWREGLLCRLTNYGVTGNIYKFTQNFLSDRTFQVRVGGAVSRKYALENGTAQGSIISPLLFSVMINDLPDKFSGVQSSLFADDSCVFKSGKDLSSITRNVNQNLKKLVDWCDEWGFNISLEKTVAVLFTHRNNAVLPMNLIIKDTKITLEKSAKFLGVVFDSKLTWKEHIEYIVKRCQKRLNLMRMISGQNWGASKKTLLMIYRSLIRAVLDYGSIVYDTTADHLLKKLDSVQYQALKIATGAILGAALCDLQVDTGELPLSLRRRELQLKYGIKVKFQPDHPAKSAFEFYRLNNNKKFCGNIQPIYNKTKEFFTSHSIDQGQTSVQTSLPPWRIVAPR